MTKSDKKVQREQIRLLFITRKYPPKVGGMERLSAGLAREFDREANMSLIAWGGSQLFLPLFLPYAFFKSLYLILWKDITHVHLGDAVLAPLGIMLKAMFPVTVSVTACGLDITFRPAIYQAIIPRAVKHLDRIICISRATLQECLKRGIPESKCTVITPGIQTDDFTGNSSRNGMEEILLTDLSRKKVLVTVGRLVKRKGVAWFIENVIPLLPANIVYAVIGTGPEEKVIRTIIRNKNLADRVIVLGGIDEADLKTIYHSADLFVMPNRVTTGNMEGFGIVALEASASGLPVVATDIEGIRDVVKEKFNGMLVNHGGNNADEWVSKIHTQLAAKKLRKQAIQNWVKKEYDWSVIGRKYISYIDGQNNS